MSRPCLFLVRPCQRLLRFFYFVSRLPVLPLTASASSEGGPNDPSPYRITLGETLGNPLNVSAVSLFSMYPGVYHHPPCLALRP